MELHEPKNLYELLTLNMEQRFANRVAFRCTTPTRMWWWKSTSGSMRRTSAAR